MARTPAPRYLGSRVREIGEIPAGRKRLARAEDVCVALLTQLNQAVDAKDRTDRRPNLADLGESGEIEQDADAVLMLYREASYLKRELTASGGDPEIGARLIERQNALEPRLARSSPVLPVLLGRVAVLFSCDAVALEEAREALPGYADVVLGQGRAEIGEVEAGLRREGEMIGSACAPLWCERRSPPIGLGATRPSRAKRARHRPALGKLHPKRSAALRRKAPAATAWTTRWRSSTGRAEDIGALPRRPTLHRASRFNTL